MKLFYPVDMKYPITQRFGENPARYPKRNGHPGLDFGCPVGANLYACDDGIVIQAGYRASGAYGREIFIQSGKWLYIYGHALDVHVTKGETVKRGQVIGASGGEVTDPMRGNSSGPHLHFEMRDLYNKPQTLPLIGAVDPLPYLQGVEEPDIVPIVIPSDKMTVVTDFINVRLTPDTKIAPVGRVLSGTKVTVLGEPVNGFYPVKFWVSGGDGEYLK